MDRGPQYIRSIRKRVHNILFNVEKGPQCISSMWEKVYNILVNTEVSTIN